MAKIYYCEDCKRVLNNKGNCDYCNKDNIKELKVGKSVNVIGTKTKGKYLRKLDKETVQLIIKDDMNNKKIKEYKIDELKKIL
ncbi:hypothetical protein [Clostridium oceanicum]|uniref:DUF2116 family Zn-ribbon domain-containing protein n=1 Tax=Clostridium oceanicum TaxID=1543 RepID=A0ABP3V3W5_9CLOT